MHILGKRNKDVLITRKDAANMIRQAKRSRGPRLLSMPWSLRRYLRKKYPDLFIEKLDLREPFFKK